jgi:hypothetical protein
MPKASDQPIYAARFVVPGTGYLTYFGTDYDRGELLTLRGGTRDSRLLDMAYIVPVEKAEQHLVTQCGVCGKEFLNDYFRDEHGKRRHRNRFADDLEVSEGVVTHMGPASVRDTTGDAEEKRLMAEAPLHLENTLASRRANAT